MMPDVDRSDFTPGETLFIRLWNNNETNRILIIHFFVFISYRKHVLINRLLVPWGLCGFSLLLEQAI